MKTVYLEKKVPKENKFRFYSVSISPTLFGDWALIRNWGRIGCKGSSKEEWFESEEAADIAGEKLLIKKKKKGYK